MSWQATTETDNQRNHHRTDEKVRGYGNFQSRWLDMTLNC